MRLRSSGAHGALLGTLALAGGCSSGPPPSVLAARAMLVRGAAATTADAVRLPATPPPDADLAEYVRLALHHDPGIQAAFEEWHAALARIDQQDALPDPRLTWAHFVEPIETRTGPQENRVSLAQTLPWFGKLAARGDVAALHAEALWWRVEARRAAVARMVAAAWFDYGFLGRELRITRDNLALLVGLEPVVQRRVQGGGSQAQLLQLQVEIGKLEDQVARLESFRAAVSARLAALMDLPTVEPLPWPELGEPEIEVVELAAARRLLAQRNPELRELQTAIARERRRVDAAELEDVPDLMVGVDWFDTDHARMGGVRGSGDDPVAVSVGINLPIGRAKYRAMVAEAEHARAAAARRLDQRGNELHVELQMALYRHDDAARQIALYRDTLVPRARQALTLTESAYGEGSASLLDVIDRQRALLAFQLAYWRASAELGKSEAELQALTGAWVDRMVLEDGGER